MTCELSSARSVWKLTYALPWGTSTGQAAGIVLDPGPEYATRKQSLSPERRELLELAEEAIAADPDRPRLEHEGVLYEFSDDFVAVAFRRTGPHRGELIAFRFYDEA